MVTPPVSHELPTPKYKEAIQAVAKANTLQAGYGRSELPQAFTHHETQTTPMKMTSSAPVCVS